MPGIYSGLGYFAPTYFAPSYFGGITPGVLLADCLIDAVAAWLELHGGGLATYIGTGLAPPGVEMPYVMLHEISDDWQSSTTAGDYVARGIIQMSTFGVGKSEVRTLSKQLANTLHDAPLVYADGVLLRFRQSSRPVTIQDPVDFANGRNVWQESRSFSYVSAGNYISGA